MNNSTRFIGMDDSKDAIQVAIAEDGRQGEVREYGAIPNTPDALRKLVRGLGRPRDLNFVYEAGPCGYGTCPKSKRTIRKDSGTKNPDLTCQSISADCSG